MEGRVPAVTTAAIQPGPTRDVPDMGSPVSSVRGHLCIRIICWDVRTRELCDRVSGALKGLYSCGFFFCKIWGPYGVGALGRKIWIYP